MVEDEYFDSNYPVLHNEFNSFGYEDKNKMLVFISHLNEHFKPVGNGNPVASASHRSAAQLRVSELFFANHTKVFSQIVLIRYLMLFILNSLLFDASETGILHI